MFALTIIFVLLATPMFFPVGVDARYDGELLLSLRVGPFRFSLDLKKRKARKQKKEKKKEPGEKKARLGKDQIKAMIPLALRALGRVRRALSIDLIQLHYVAGSEDPADAAMQMGAVSAGAGALLPLLGSVVTVREYDIKTSADFDAVKPNVIARIVATFLLWELFYIGLAFLVEFLNYEYRNR